MVDQNFRMAGRRHPFGLVDILEADRDAVQRAAAIAAHDLGLGGTGRREGRFSQHPDKAVELAVEALDAREAALGELDRRELALADKRGGLGDRQEIGDHTVTPSAAGRCGRARRPSRGFSAPVLPFPR